MEESPDEINLGNISFDDFCKLDSIKYWRQQLNGANIKNIKNESQLGGTRNTYTYGLLEFHNWLLNRKFQYTTTIQIDRNLMQLCKTTVRLEGVEHLLELSRKDNPDKADFARLIKKYLAETLSVRKQSTVKISMYSIKSFFRENESDIVFQFKHRIRRPLTVSAPSLSLRELRRILTVSDIQPIEKAVFLCKFQRGLDSSTLADRFNFEVWECLLKHFGSDKPESWDLDDAPVPVPLVRVKTGFMHAGFLDVDAVAAIVEYLKTRHGKPEIGNALFIDTKQNPITVNWISRRFHKLVLRSKSHSHIPKCKTENGCTSHKMRHLLKSTLIDSGCRADVADHVIGHNPKDSYEKQLTLYPESVIHEFAKASERINLFTGSKKDTHEEDSLVRNNEPLYGRPHDTTSVEESLKKIQERMERYERQFLQMKRHVSQYFVKANQ